MEPMLTKSSWKNQPGTQLTDFLASQVRKKGHFLPCPGNVRELGDLKKRGIHSNL